MTVVTDSRTAGERYAAYFQLFHLQDPREFTFTFIYY